MNTITKRLLCLLLAIGSFFSLTACSTGNNTDKQTTDESLTSAESDKNNAEEIPRDNLPELDFNGAAVKIMHFGIENAVLKDAVGDDSGGDVVSDAVYNRNLHVEDRLKIRFVWTAGNDVWHEYPMEVETLILAGDFPQDMVFMESSECFRLSLQGYFRNVADLPYIDLEQPWWYTDFMNDGTITPDKRYLLTGAFSITTLEGASAVVFNKKLFDDNFKDYNELYDIVESNDWTYDKFLEYCTAVYKDQNGNNEKDAEDVWGFVNRGIQTVNYMSMSTGLSYITRNEKGYPMPDLYNEATLKWVDTLYTMLYGGEAAYTVSDAAVAYPHFTAGKALFFPGQLSEYTDVRIREMDAPYGVVPMPVIEYGLPYMSAAGTVNGESAVIPTTTAEDMLELCGAVLEALSSEAYRTVVPAWYEVALKSKHADTKRDADMIDLIYDTIDTSFIMMADKLLGTGSFFNTAVNINQISAGEFASYYEANAPTLDTKWADMLKAYEDLPE